LILHFKKRAATQSGAEANPSVFSAPPAFVPVADDGKTA